MHFEAILADKDIHESQEIDTSLIKISQEVRDLCKQNTCGSYGKNYMCPPNVKGLEKWKTEIFSFDQALLLSKIYKVKSSFDWKGMMAGLENFEGIITQIDEELDASFPEFRHMVLGAGPCMVCKTCSCIDDEPCRFPEKAHPSLEACGIDVVRLCKRAGMSYNNGANTVTYLGMLLF